MRGRCTWCSRSYGLDPVDDPPAKAPTFHLEAGVFAIPAPRARHANAAEGTGSKPRKASKERKTMQELQQEMNMRLQTLGNQIARLEDDRDEHLRDIARIDRETERARTLKTQYQQVLDAIPAPA